MSNDRERPPLIGITGIRRLGGEIERTPPFLRTTPVDAFVTHYGNAVTLAGGLPVLLTRDSAWHGLLHLLDGVVLTGGEDVEPRIYGGLPTRHSAVLDVERDAFELELVTAAREEQLPILAICRGIQVLNVAFGGTLISHLSSDDGERHSFFGYPGDYRSHAVETTPGSIVSRLYGARVRVNSFHHQAVDLPGDSLAVTAYADDQVAEAVESADGMTLGVQWHPEMLADDPLFDWIVERASERRDRTRAASGRSLA